MYTFSNLVLKIASRCNLNCSYCFMYNLGDDSYKLQPKFMSDEVLDALVTKVERYVLKNNLDSINFLLHGGEPLLAGKKRFLEIISKLRSLNKRIPNFQTFFSIQTNGVLLDDEWLYLLKKNDVFIGISLDGTKEAHDKYRVDHKGRGSYEEVKKALLLSKNVVNEANVVCVLDEEQSSKKMYENFKDLGVTSLNLLLKDFTKENFPYANNEDYNLPFANFLIELFDLWFFDKERYRITLFHGLCSAIIGTRTISDENSNEFKSLVIETNGEIEPIDSLKACGNKFTKTRVNVKTHEIEDIFNTSLGSLYFNESLQACAQCKNCPIYEICNGGRLVHRYSKENGFDNPSVYCKDMIKLVAHIQHRLLDSFPDIDKDTIEKLDYTKIINENSMFKRQLENERLSSFKVY